MTFAEFVSVATKRWVLIVASVVLVTMGSFALAESQTPMYRSSSSSYFSLELGDSASDILQGSNYTQQQLGSFARLATEPVVLNEVIEELGLNETPKTLGRQVSASTSPDTVIIDITVTDGDPDQAAAIANSVSSQLAAVVKALSPKLADGKPSVSAMSISRATPASYAYSPNTRRSVAIGFTGGLLLGLLIAIARESLDTRVRRAEDLPDGVEVLAEVEDMRGLSRLRKQFRRMSSERFNAVRTESYRKLRTNLRFLDVDNPVKVLVVTSSVAGEGKSTTAIALARVLAESGERVLLVDGDLRQPKVAEYLGLEGSLGLADVLAGTIDLGTAVQEWGDEGLYVLASGSIPPNPSELLGSRAFGELVTKVRNDFDHVVIDSPPLLPVTDASVASVMVDGVVVVVRYGRTAERQVKRATESLGAVEARILGAVMNATPVGRSWVSSAGYGYYSPPDEDVRRHVKTARQDEVEPAVKTEREATSQRFAAAKAQTQRAAEVVRVAEEQYAAAVEAERHV